MALTIRNPSGAGMGASPKVYQVASLSEERILGERLWMLAAARRLEPYFQVETGSRSGLRVTYPLPDLNAYFEAAGPIPDYDADPRMAEFYHDELASWFWSAYAVALARMDIDSPFTDSASRVVDRLRARALGSASRRKAA